MTVPSAKDENLQGLFNRANVLRLKCEFDKAEQIYNHFKDRINVSFGIGTFLSNDTHVDALNIVIKLQYVNGHPVAKLSDTPGKAMCQEPQYVEYLKNAVNYRLQEGI